MNGTEELPQPTPDELQEMLARSLDEAYAGWTATQRAIYLAVWRNHRQLSGIGRYLGLPEETVRREMEGGMFGYLLWDRSKPDPYVNVK